MKKGRKGFSEPLLCADRNGVKKGNVMGGTVFETESKKLIRRGKEAAKAEGKAEEIIEMGQEFGLDDVAILKRMRDRIGLSLEQGICLFETIWKITCIDLWSLAAKSARLFWSLGNFAVAWRLRCALCLMLAFRGSS